jgi:hypothetical protein
MYRNVPISVPRGRRSIEIGEAPPSQLFKGFGTRVGSRRGGGFSIRLDSPFYPIGYIESFGIRRATSYLMMNPSANSTAPTTPAAKAKNQTLRLSTKAPIADSPIATWSIVTA